jgi:uncharacterized protein involved in response to NO
MPSTITIVVFVLFVLGFYLFAWQHIPLFIRPLILKMIAVFFISTAVYQYYMTKHKTWKDLSFLGIFLVLPP